MRTVARPRFSVSLDSQPTADVTLAVSSSDPGEGVVSPTSLVFTSDNWNQPQTVTVTGQNDPVVDGDVVYQAVLAPASSADATYNGFDAPDVSITNWDTDTADILVSPTAGLETTEQGGTASFSVVLTSQPTANVTIGIASSAATEGSVSASLLVFTAANWDEAQSVTITGQDDSVDDDDVNYTILVAAATSDDSQYDGRDAPDVAVRNIDDDTAAIAVSPIADVTTTEQGGTGTFTVVLASQPIAQVTISLTSSAPNEGLVSPASLVFAAADWDQARSVTVTGQDDAVDDDDVDYSIVLEAAVSSDPKYHGLDAPDVSVRNIDDDTAGIVVQPTSGLETDEEGGIASFSLVLATQPTAPVSVPLVSSDLTEGLVSPANLVFTADNWHQTQTATITGQGDGVTDGDVGYTIAVGPAVSDDSKYDGSDPADVSVTNLNRDGVDLIVSELVTPTGTLIGNPAQAEVSWTVENRGSLDAVAPWTDRVVFSSNGVLGDGDDQTLADVQHASVLTPSATYSVTEGYYPARELDRWLLPVCR